MKRILLFTFIAGLLLLNGCVKSKPAEVYHKFEKSTWQRFDILTFEVPVREAGRRFDILFFARFSPAFQFDKLGINMIMNTPSGEERIGEYTLQVKSAGGSLAGECEGDSCERSILLKRELHISRAGTIKIEIENLTPRMQTEGILGAGIRLTESGK
jgi:gliding motility-associated lipoprotein GldH